MEKLGIPTVTIATSEFIGLARTSMESFGAADMAFVVVPHPIGMIPAEEVKAKAEAAFPEILKAATEWKPERTTLPGVGQPPYPAEVVKFTGTYADVNEFFFKNGWSLGLPIVPPTRELVDEMLKGTSHSPDEVVWEAVPPRMGVLTVELVAANGVMAGCKPEHMPLLLAVVEAMSTPPKGGMEWRAQTTTTYPTAPVIMVSGPIVKELGIGYRTGAMGPEYPVNQCIGHFVNLIGDVVGGSVPPDADKSTHGWVGNIVATVFGENADENPWKQTYAEEKGFAPTDNVVTFFAGPPPVVQNDHASVAPKDLAEVMAYTMNSVGVTRCFEDGGMWVLSPEHAATLAREGWSKDDIRKFLWETARAPFWAMPPMVDGVCSITSCCPENFPKEFLAQVGEVTPDTMIPICKSPDCIEIVVAGGPGKQSQWFPFVFSPVPPISVKVDPWR